MLATDRGRGLNPARPLQRRQGVEVTVCLSVRGAAAACTHGAREVNPPDRAFDPDDSPRTVNAASTAFRPKVKESDDVGVLIYGDEGIRVALDDRTLAHVQALVNTRLRRNHPFFLWWRDARVTGNGQSALWIARRVSLVFHYRSPAPIVLNAEWMRELLLAADRPGGAFLGAEPGSSDDPRPESTVRLG